MESIINNISFTRKKVPIPPDYRPLYKIGHILLILSMTCRAGKGSMMKIHFLSWAVKSKSNLATVERWITRNFEDDLHIWGIEPTTNRAMLFAAAEGWVELEGVEFQITDSGLSLVDLMKNDADLFIEEKRFLASIGKNTITEKVIKGLSGKFSQT